jgi:hypothetical protein
MALKQNAMGNSLWLHGKTKIGLKVKDGILIKDTVI